MLLDVMLRYFMLTIVCTKLITQYYGAEVKISPKVYIDNSLPNKATSSHTKCPLLSKPKTQRIFVFSI